MRFPSSFRICLIQSRISEAESRSSKTIVQIYWWNIIDFTNMKIKRRFSKRGRKSIETKLDENLCSLCEINSNEPYLGKLLSHSNLSVHENCLYFSPVLNQESDPSGKKKDYILGFKLSEIIKEVKRITRLKCSICKKRKGGIGCCNVNCRKSFHLDCGLKNNTMGIFAGSFTFYCKEHAKPQNLTKQLSWCKKVVPECTICLELALAEEKDDSKKPRIENDWTNFLGNVKQREVIHGMCCTRCWMHKECMIKYGLSAGLHHVKCPNCANRTSFIDAIQQCGIWLPDRDASWELVPGAFQEMYENNSIHSLETISETSRNCSTNSIDCLECPESMPSNANKENINLDPPVTKIVKSPCDSTRSPIQADIRNYISTPETITKEKLMVVHQPIISKKACLKRSISNPLTTTTVVSIKGKRKRLRNKSSNEKALVYRQCRKCSKSLVCLSYHNQVKRRRLHDNINNNDDEDEGSKLNNEFICVSCYF